MKTVHPPCSDEQLNAFVDNQLESHEKDQLFAALRNDEALSRQVCALQKVREAVQFAYETPPAPPLRPAHVVRHRRSFFLQSLVASMLVLGGGVLGWLLHDRLAATEDYKRLAASAFIARPEQLLAASQDTHAILHISSADARAMERLLDDAELLLTRFAQNKRKLTLEVIANSSGLELLRADTSPYARRIAELQERFPDSITFLACLQTVQRLWQEEHIEVQLLPGAKVTPSALEQILLRLRQGWAYLRV